MPRILRREQPGRRQPPGVAYVGSAPSSADSLAGRADASPTLAVVSPVREQPKMARSAGGKARTTASIPLDERYSRAGLGPLVQDALDPGPEISAPLRPPVRSRTQRLSPDPLQCPLPHIPDGLCQEREGSVRSLATMVVAYHETVPVAMQEEFIRQVMKFAGEKAGQLIRASWEAP